MNKFSDITIADPWLEQYIREEKFGRTLIICNDNISNTKSLLLKKCFEDGYIYIEHIPLDIAIKSQSSTIQRKQSYRENKKIIGLVIRIVNHRLYRKVFLNSFCFPLHCKIKNRIERYLRNCNKNKKLR